MPKRKTTSTTTNSVSAVTKAATGHTVPTNVKFPELSTKKGLECRVLMEDQVLLIDNLFSVDECKRFVKFIDELPLELTPPKKRGEAERMNHRISIISPDFAARLFDVIGPHLPNFPYPASVATKARATARTGHSLNSNIRMYKYTPNQHFGPHYDDAVVDPSGNGSRSEWTLLIYLTGVEDGVKGGETVFYLDNKMKKQVKAPLNRGTALLHRHGHECLLHEGSKVESGTKYILRSDLMFVN
ncbi:hypothetical protein BDM02DRAFT_3108445 [Thelephora ganbajun]|uniref:Uncharacterized protein n=1 Tax=Thelephora ganbajun TaxID=370292 RepID=A0ACB6ZTG9_THEGA|nr:hypothetical protein BDM02DRAFT_3108445 [Thelephora ganbajun]